MKKLLIGMMAILLAGCSYFNSGRPVYYSYIQKLNTGTVVKSESVSTKDINYSNHALAVANDVLKYKEVKEVAVFYSEKNVIVGYSVVEEDKENKVPSTTNGLFTPPNHEALKQSILQTVKNQIGDGTVHVQVAEKAEFEKAFKGFSEKIKGMEVDEVKSYIEQIVNELRM